MNINYYAISYSIFLELFIYKEQDKLSNEEPLIGENYAKIPISQPTPKCWYSVVFILM